MVHARTNIRRAFIDLLIGATDAGARIYDSRIYTLEKRSLPEIIVFSDHEEIITDTISWPRSQERSLRVSVECYVKSGNEVSSAVDNISAQVESLILASSNLGGICKDCRLEATDISLNNDGEQPVALASLVFAVLYRTLENSPEIIV
ncbi:MAG: hypothetical protein COA94_01020 [Rickettsiales bacterium]|nr:MAG: hypothetical protein COA94_01020 [Rickettsiales bacterium]